MADARPLLRIRGGIKAQSVWLCRGGRASGGGQGTHSGDRVAITQGRSGSHSRSIATCSAVFINPLLLLCGPICGSTPARGGDQAHAHMVHSPRAVPCSAPVVLGFPPSAVHILFRARPAVQSAYDANSTFVIRPDALAGFAAALLVPRYVAGVRGVEDEKRSFPVQLTVATCTPIHSR